MYVVEVIPLRRGVAIESLSYFSGVNYKIGTFVEVPVRGKKLVAIVTSSKPVSSTKTALKAATFSLRKLPAQASIRSLPQTVLDLLSSLKAFVPASPGAILCALLPPDVRSGSCPYPHTTPHYGTEDATPSVLQATTQERYVAYRSYIRSQFAHRGSVLFVVPTAADVSFAVAELAAGIEDRVAVFSPLQKRSERQAAYASLEDLSTAKLIIATPAFAYLDRADYLSIIIERAGSGHYKLRRRPYLDHKEVLKQFAKVTGRTVILGDTLLATEDEYQRRREVFHTEGEHPKRLSIKSKLTVVEQTEKPTPEVPFRLFSTELGKLIENTVSGKGRIFLYAARRGLAPLVVCFDCGHIFRCPDSGAPYSLLRTFDKGEEKRWFLCATSGKRTPAADVCTACGSWRLRERGIGIQQVVDTFKTTFPHLSYFHIDQETAPTHKRASAIINDFYNQKGAVLIGTAMTLPLLQQPLDASAILSVDAARAIPSWRTDEHFFALLLRLREISRNQVLVQTRTQVDDLLLYAARGAIDRFYDDEIKLRELLSYPPLSVFILLSWQGSKEATQLLEDKFSSMFSSYHFDCYSSPVSSSAKTVRYGLLRIKQEDWPNEQLTQLLRSLPPQVKIEVNPDRIV